MNKNEFRKLVKRYIVKRWGYLNYKSLYIDIDEWSYGYIATCVIVVNTAFVEKIYIHSNVEKTSIESIRCESKLI